MTERSDLATRNDALLRWYAEGTRDLPWRAGQDPYVTLVSECMLQQTQVDRVVPKFDLFMTHWPTVHDLATCDTSELLEVWSGLGYNSRALRLRAAAQMIDSRGWPTSVEDLQELPGIGPYTARAIASIAFAEDVAAIDTNLRRVLSRWHGSPLDGRELETYAQENLRSPAGAWNQAMMDLGATTCRPKNPRCDRCPVATWCGDPTVYAPPPRQSRFSGSNRELRGALVRANLDGTDLLDTGLALGKGHQEIVATIDSLSKAGLLPTSSE